MNATVRMAFDHEDRQRVLGLMQEYSEKLRGLCDNWNAARGRQMQLFLLLVVSIMTTGLVAIALFPKLPNADVDELRSYAAFASIISVIVLISASISFNRNKIQYDIHEVAAILKRLLQAVSQQHEHTLKNPNYLLADQFEIDIRLAEAEAALRMYELTIVRKSVMPFLNF